MATKVRGADRLWRKLQRLPEEVKAAIRPTMEEGAKEIVALMKSRVAVEEGDLRDSIGWTWGEAPQGSLAVETISASGLKITVYAGNQDVFWARWIELGTSKASAQPFFFSSYNDLKKRVKAKIGAAVKKAVRKVAASG